MLTVFSKFLNTIFLFVLIVQAAVFAHLKYKGYIGLPAVLLDFALEKYFDETIDFKIGGIKYYPHSGLEIADIRVFKDNTKSPVIKLEAIHLDLESSRDVPLVDADFRGIAKGGYLFYPEAHIPEDEAIRLMEGARFTFGRQNGDFFLDDIRGRISNLNIVGNHPVYLRQSNTAIEGEISLSDEVIDRIREVFVVREIFKNAEESTLTFRVEHVEGQPAYAYFNLFSEGSQLESYSIGDLNLRGKLALSSNPQGRETITGQLQYFRDGNEMKASNIDLKLNYQRDGLYSVVPDSILLNGSKIELHGDALDYALVDIKFPNQEHVEFIAKGSLRRQNLNLEGVYDRSAQSGELKVYGWFNPEYLADCFWVNDPKILDRFRFEKTPYFELSAKLAGDQTIEDIRFSFLTLGMNVMDVPIGYAKATGRYDSKQIHLDRFCAYQPGYAIEGSLSKNIDTSAYRYILIGSFLPTEYNPWFKDWWSRTWVSFDFGADPATTNMDIWGVLDDENDRYVYGDIHFGSMDFKGLKLDRGSVRMLYLAKYTHLFDMQISQGDYQASGSVKTVYETWGIEEVSKRFNFQSNFPIRAISSPAAEEVGKYLDLLDGDIAPELNLQGVVVDEQFEQFAHLQDLKISINQQKPFKYAGIELQSAELIAVRNDEGIIIEPFKFEFADGMGSGVIRLTKPEDAFITEFEFQLEDFDYHVAINKIDILKPEESLEDDILKTANTDKSERSFMDLQFAGSGELGDWDSFTAEGEFLLDDPLIQRVHLFGGISKLLDNSALNLGSFSLKQATSSVRLAEMKLHFDDMRMTGPTSRVDAKGSIDLATQGLDFRLKAYPLRETKTPIVSQLGMIISPIAHLFEVNARGTFDDPEWKLVIDAGKL